MIVVEVAIWPVSEGKLFCSKGDAITMVSQRLSEQQSTTGLKVALRIIQAWQAAPARACRTLRISPSKFRRASKGASAGSRLELYQHQHQRIGMVLGIHASLRTVFDNPANVQGFPGFSTITPFLKGARRSRSWQLAT